MPDTSRKMRYLVPALVLLIGATSLIMGWYVSKHTAEKMPAPQQIETSDTPAPDTTATAALDKAAEITNADQKKAEAEVGPVSKPIPVMQPQGRFIGREDAPVHMIEFASLSCTHCAHFHNDVLDEFRVKYVDSGKVRLEFRSFPLNQQALDGLKLLNCLPEEQFYPFMSMLFQTQDRWAFEKNYKDILKQNAKLAGLPDDKIDFCLNDKGYEEKTVQGLVKDIEKYKLQSTPTFILNDGAETIVGAGAVSDFAPKIEGLINGTAAAQTPAASEPATTETTPTAKGTPAP